LQPYEKRAVELLKIGKDKRTLKFLKRRVSIEFYSKSSLTSASSKIKTPVKIQNLIKVFFLPFIIFKLGTHTRSRQKRDEMQNYLAAARKANK
jgi:hypothetical protein